MSNFRTAPAVRMNWTDANLRSICFSLWDAHLHWLHSAGFLRAYDEDDAVERVPPSGHEIVDWLGEYVFETKRVNAHLGLTSSDVIDNARLMALDASLRQLTLGVEEVIQMMGQAFPHEATMTGYTHLQPAAPIAWTHRVKAWTEPLKWLASTRPTIHAKGFGGPVGDAASLRLIFEHMGTNIESHPFDWSVFDVSAPRNVYQLQSSDHHCEFEAVQWMARVAAQLHKMANDLRILHSMREVKICVPALAGSSSMPHKVNPYKWEKVCSACRSLSSAQNEVFDVLAHNALERTLDTSWQLKNVLARSTCSLATALDAMLSCEFVVDLRHSQDNLVLHRNKISSDRDLVRNVLAGKSRWSAYWDAINARKD